MKKIFPFLIMLLFALAACTPQVVVVTVEVPQQPANDSSTVGEAAPTAAPETNTELADTSTTAEEPTATPVPVVSTGDIATCKLPARAIDDPYQYQRLGVPRSSGFVPSTGTVEVAVLFFDYSDARASSSPEQALGVLSPFALSQFIRDISYGQAELVIKPYATWLNLNQPASHYKDILWAEGRSEVVERDLLQEVVNLADSNVDFSNTDILFVIANPDASDDFEGPWLFGTADDALGFQADGNTIRGGVLFGSDAVNPDRAAYYRNFGAGRGIMQLMTLQALGYSSAYSSDPVQRTSSVGSFSVNGSTADEAHAPGPFAFERWQLGWLQDGQIVCQTGSEQTTDLSAIENAGGTKAVIVPLGNSSALVVESRRAVGTDQELIKEGALVYTVDTSLAPGDAPIRVLPMPDNDLYRDQSPLAQGESITHCNITITNVAAGPDGDSVKVSINGPISCEGETASTGQDTAAQPTTAPEPTAVAEPTDFPDLCANIDAPPEGSDVRIYIPNYTEEQIWATFIDYPGVFRDDLTFSAQPGEYIEYWTDKSQLIAILDANKEIIRIFIAGEGPTQCEGVTSTEQDETGKLVFITFTNSTNEAMYICRENERLERCGILYPGDTSSPHPMYPTGAYYFVGMDSGATSSYLATDAENQATTITK